MKKNDITCSTCSTFLKRWIKSNERMSKACTNSRLRSGGGGGGKRKKKNRREDKNKKTNNEREQENQATCKRVALYEQKREGRKDSTHKVRGSRLKAKAEARKRKK